MSKAKRWTFYCWDPAELYADRRVWKLEGLQISILRAFHDVLWQTEEKQIVEDDLNISQQLDIEIGLWRTTKHKCLEVGVLYREEQYLRSPHIDDCWAICERRSKTGRENVMNRYKNQ